jgi:hypothetical protein
MHLLCVGGESNLITVRSIESTEDAIMNEIHIIARLAQTLLAVGMTLATGLIFLTY